MIAFETLIYTDCVPGQGLQGSAGLQFQARSPGADRAAMSIVQAADLYEPPASWMRERRPVQDYPPSFAHAYDGVYATAAGVYLGREANGGREGNQLTHAIVTTDPASYQLHRPAQLFGAPFWSTQPAPTTECDPVRQPWEPGPFDIGAAKALVTERPHGTEMLDRLLSSLRALGKPNARRVLFISEDAAEVLHWISAATLLLPQRDALAIGFKVFSTNPAYATQPVIAVHPDWDSTSVTVDDDGGYAVFDLTRYRSSPVPVDDHSARWVRLLLDEDPYDVLDMVETASASGRDDPDEALELAQSMVLQGRPLSLPGARIAVSWLKTTPPTLLAPFREKLMDELLGDVKQWPEDILLDLDEVVRTGQTDPERMPQVRVALISAELDRAARQGTASKIRLDALPTGLWKEECEARVVQELRDVQDPRMFDAVLRVAHRFGLAVRLDQVGEAVGTFVGKWAGNPELDFDITLWGTAQRPLWRALNAELTRRVLEGHADEVGDAWRESITVGLPLSDAPLQAALLAAQMVKSDPDRRAALIDETLGPALDIAPEDRGATVGRTVEALWRRVAPTMAEYRQLTEMVPAAFPLDPHLFQPLVQSMTSRDALLEHEDIEVLRGLYDKELIPRTAQVERIVHSDEDLRAVCERLPRADPEQLAEFPRVVSSTAMSVRGVWARELVAAMLEVKHPYGSDRLLKQVPHKYHAEYLRTLLERLRKPSESVSVVIAYQLAGVDFLGPENRDACLKFVEHWIRKAGDKRRKQATELVNEIATRERRQVWAAMLDSSEDGRSWPWRRKADG